MTSQQLRRLFLDYFAERDHLIRPSAPLVLRDDPTSFFTSAGVQPYMNAFRGLEPPPAPRVASCQKCCRTSDIEGVGVHNRYHTFFEMLGNFSFGDYFKKEAIEYGWEFVTEVLKLDKDRLYITVFEEDTEAEELWRSHIGVPADRILHLGRKHNWWPQVRWEGPCGPCTEIHVDLGPEFGCPQGCDFGCEKCDRYLELWNIVFQQFTEAEDGSLTPLPAVGVDTGMGLERLAVVMQGVASTYETDELFTILQAALEQINNQRSTPYAYGEQREGDIALSIICDHLRAVAFLMADGVVPSNEGAGYVLRRLIRRAFRSGYKLGAAKPFLYRALHAVREVMGQQYPELNERQEYVTSVLRSEEERFAQTLEQGMARFEEIAEHLQKQGETVISGKRAFELYDTFGFPLDITRELARERGLVVDEGGFAIAMSEARERSRGEKIGLTQWETEGMADDIRKLAPTEFVGYERVEVHNAKVVSIIGVVGELTEGQDATLVITPTPFYPERGGQVGDTGVIEAAENLFEVKNTTSHGHVILHKGTMRRGTLKVNDTVTARVDAGRRAAIKRNHTATHLLQAALRRVLGQHVVQAGSYVGPDRLRFDFTHHRAVTQEQLDEVEDQVNEWIVQALPVTCAQMPLEEAKAAGAIALFGEKYEDIVRAVRIGDDQAPTSFELCAGTHVRNTGEIGMFRILSESSVAAGTRRIEAVAGLEAARYSRSVEQQLRTVAQHLNCRPWEVLPRVKALEQQVRELQEELKAARQVSATTKVDDLLAAARDINGVKFVAWHAEGADMQMIGALADDVAARLGDSIVFLAGTQGERAIFVCKVAKSLVDRGYRAGDIIKAAAAAADGKGGGKPAFAQGGGKAGKVQEALEAAAAFVAGIEGQ